MKTLIVVLCVVNFLQAITISLYADDYIYLIIMFFALTSIIADTLRKKKRIITIKHEFFPRLLFQ